jgi:hypothetical protein
MVMDIGVCAVCVGDGQVEIFGPDGEMTALNGAVIADFRTAPHGAIGQAEADLQYPRLK